MVQNGASSSSAQTAYTNEPGQSCLLRLTLASESVSMVDPFLLLYRLACPDSLASASSMMQSSSRPFMSEELPSTSTPVMAERATHAASLAS